MSSWFDPKKLKKKEGTLHHYITIEDSMLHTLMPVLLKLMGDAMLIGCPEVSVMTAEATVVS